MYPNAVNMALVCSCSAFCTGVVWISAGKSKESTIDPLAGRSYFHRMAEQTGDIKITGSIDDICFYRMEGRYYARLKSSLSRTRFFNDPVFEGSRKSAFLLAAASQLSSRLYHTLRLEFKGRGVYQELTGQIKLFMAQGMTEDSIKEWFCRAYHLKCEQKETVAEPKLVKPVLRQQSIAFTKSLFTVTPISRIAHRFPRSLQRRGNKTI